MPVFLGCPYGLTGKESACNTGDLGSIPGLGRSPGEGKGYHCSILAWRIHRVGYDCMTFTLLSLVPQLSNDMISSVSSVQSLSRVQLFETPWTVAHQASLSITNSRSSLKPMSIESVMPSNHLILCRPLLLPPSILPASGSFQMSPFSASGGQSIRVT